MSLLRRCLLGFAAGAVALVIRFAIFGPGVSQAQAPEGGWAFHGGDWSQQGAAVSQKDASGRSVALRGAARQAYSARVRVRPQLTAPGSSAGLLLQADDANNYVALAVERRTGGMYLVLKTRRDGKKGGWWGEEGVGDQAPIPADVSGWQELRAEVDGPHVAGYLDGKPLVQFSFVGTPPKWNSHGQVWTKDLDNGRAGLYTNRAAAEFRDFEVGERGSEPIYTAYRPHRDSSGRVMPRQSYAETFSAWTRWCAESVRHTDYRDAPAEVHSWPFYLLSSFVFSDDVLGTDIQYPGHNHPPFIEGFLKQYMFSGEKLYLDRARELADWNLAHSTPDSWAVRDLALSHFDFRKHLKSLDALANGDFEPDKSAFQGLAYLELYAATEDQKYLDAAVRIADALRKLQRPDGGFPFRVRPLDGKITAPYTASIIWYVRFFEDLAGFTGNADYRGVRDRAFRWLLENPVRTNNWQGFYGDIATGSESYDQWTALDTAMYLLERRAQDASYEATARRLVKWVEDKLVVPDGLYPGVPGIWEQTSYKVVLSIHTNRLAEVYARMWGELCERRYRDLAEQIGNGITWFQMSDGKMRAGLWYHVWGTATSGIIFDPQYMRIMAEVPETAPRGENHFLHHTGYVREVSYAPDRVVLRAWSPGVARFSLHVQPASVSDETGAIRRTGRDGAARPGWSYDPKTGLLRVRHAGKRVEIRFREARRG